MSSDVAGLESGAADVAGRALDVDGRGGGLTEGSPDQLILISQVTGGLSRRKRQV